MDKQIKNGVDQLISKYEVKMQAVKTLLKDIRTPISNFTLAQEQCFMKILEELKDLKSCKDEDDTVIVEQAKAKIEDEKMEFDLKNVIEQAFTEHDLKCTWWDGDYDYESTNKTKEHLFNVINPYTANLEAQNKALREALEECTCFIKDNITTNWNGLSKAEQALK